MSNVHVLYEDNFRDPVAMLRRLAGDIEEGTYGEAESLAIVLKSEHGIAVFGFGAFDDLKTLGLLSVGRDVMSRILVGDDE